MRYMIYMGDGTACVVEAPREDLHAAVCEAVRLGCGYTADINDFMDEYEEEVDLHGRDYVGEFTEYCSGEGFDVLYD